MSAPDQPTLTLKNARVTIRVAGRSWSDEINSRARVLEVLGEPSRASRPPFVGRPSTLVLSRRPVIDIVPVYVFHRSGQIGFSTL